MSPRCGAWRNPVIVWLVAWTLLACGAEVPYRQQAFVFGTLVDVTVVGVPEAQARSAMGAVLTEFDALHRQLHAWQPSELSRLNAAFARGENMTVSPALAAMLGDAKRLANRSNELFNPAIGGLIGLWGFHNEEQQTALPATSAIADWVARRPSMHDVHIDGLRVWSENRAVRLDLGGYAKGYALDAAVRILKAHGVHNALVNIGGNVIALGRHGERPWRVGIQHPRRAGTLATLDLHDGEAVGTSGDYQRFFEVGGRRYSHLIDPRSGRPATAMQSVTILVTGKAVGVRSDALSKPLFIVGPSRLAATASELGIAAYFAVDAAGTQTISPAMKARLR